MTITAGGVVISGGGGGTTNPMTTLGDLIRGGASGTPGRLAVGADGTVLTAAGGIPSWAAAAGGVAISTATPQPPGTAAAGSTGEASDAGHVHAAPTPAIPLLAGVVSTVLGADTVAGYGYVDPTGLASLTLAAVGQVVSGTVTGTLDLYDLTAAAVVATLTWTETVATRKTASVTVPGTARLYELRVRKSGGGDTDYALISAASMIGS